MNRLTTLFIYIIPFALYASEAPADSVTSHHRQLQELEVVGVKQGVSVEIAPVTTLTPEMIKRYDVVSMGDISEMAPNFYMPSYGSRMTSSIYVRGLGARMDQPIVGLSVDNVPVMNKDGYDFDIPDIARIEVVRGAQSLLNGRNTMGGQINVRTLSPMDYTGWRAMAYYGRGNSLRLGVSNYMRPTEAWGSAISVLANSSDGFFRNEANGKKIDSDRSASLRWKLCWQPSTWLSATNTASASVTRQGGYPYESVATGKIAYNDTCYYHRTTFADGLTLVWAGKRVVVTSVSSLQYINDNMTLDQDFTLDDYFTLTQKRHEWSLTEDLYAKGSRGRYSWLGGVFAFSKTGKMSAPVTFFDTGISRLIEQHRNQINPTYPISWDSREFVLGSDFSQGARGVALYQESTYTVGGWTLQAGLRWDVEWASLDYRSHCNTGYETYQVKDDGTREPFRHTPLNLDDRGKLRKTYMELLPKISAAYNYDHIQVYASASKGYKAGGYNTQMFSDVLQQRIMQFMGMAMSYNLDQTISYKPEKSWNFEIGAKSRWLDDRLTADATLYYIDCRNQQLTMFPPGVTTGRIMTNAGRTRSFGAELSAAWRPNDVFGFVASYGYTNATFRRFADSKGNYRGKKLPYAPNQTLFAGATVNLPCEILSARPSLNVNVRGVGDIYWNEANSLRQNAYALLGASATLAGRGWSVKLWGENLTSARYSTFYFVSIGNEFVQRGAPWTAGVTVRLDFE